MNDILGIGIISATALLGTQEASIQETIVEQCFIVVNEEGAPPIPMDVGVIEFSAGNNIVDLNIPDGYTLSNITCMREQLRLAQNDYIIPLSGVPLVLFIEDSDGNRTGISLTIEEDQFAVSIVQGEISDTDRAAIVESLEGFYAALENDNGE